MTFAEIGCEQSRLVFKGSDSRVTPTVGAFSFVVAIRCYFWGRTKGEGRAGLPPGSISDRGKMVVRDSE
jgi:hypothetical protein